MLWLAFNWMGERSPMTMPREHVRMSHADSDALEACVQSLTERRLAGGLDDHDWRLV